MCLMFIFINIVGCFLFQFQVMKLFTVIYVWCDEVLYTITIKNVDNNTFMLRMFFRNLRFSRCLLCSSFSITKRAIFLFSLYLSCHRDTLTVGNGGISCSFFHDFINAMSVSNFLNFVFIIFSISNNFNQILPMLLLNIFENIISGMQLYNKNLLIKWRLNHFLRNRDR